MDLRVLQTLAELPEIDGVPMAARALESIPLPISIIRAMRTDGEIEDFCIEYLNAAAATTVSSEDRLRTYGRPLIEVMPAFVELGLLDRYRAVVEQQQTLVQEGLSIQSEFDGNQIDIVIDVVGVPLGDDRVLSISHDRTREHVIGRELTAAEQQLERRRAVERQVRAVNDGLVAHLVEIQRALDAGDVSGAQRHATAGASEAADLVVGLRNLMRLRPN